MESQPHGAGVSRVPVSASRRKQSFFDFIAINPGRTEKSSRLRGRARQTREMRALPRQAITFRRDFFVVKGATTTAVTSAAVSEGMAGVD